MCYYSGVGFPFSDSNQKGSVLARMGFLPFRVKPKGSLVNKGKYYRFVFGFFFSWSRNNHPRKPLNGTNNDLFINFRHGSTLKSSVFEAQISIIHEHLISYHPSFYSIFFFYLSDHLTFLAQINIITGSPANISDLITLSTMPPVNFFNLIP